MGGRTSLAQRLERGLEGALWGSRVAMLAAVVAGVLMAFGMLYTTSVDVVGLLGTVLRYGGEPYAGEELRTKLITGVIKALDGYLVAAILFIFALGLYELFISRIQAAERSESAPRLLIFSSIDDLKDKLAKLVLLVLVIEFFQEALNRAWGSALELLYFAVGILLVGAALYLTSGKAKAGGKPGE